MSVIATARLQHFWRDVLQTAFRLLPWPTAPGLRPIGHPTRSSPVLITGNYDLTVRRVVRAVDSVDAWLLIAPSHGVNVWCAASGGHLTTHQIVTALKTSGIEERVDHRHLVLPQLSATGVQAPELFARTGWRARFGPVYARDLPAYLKAGMKKTDAMRVVHFGARERLEMAVAWAAPTALVVGAVLLVFHRAWAVACMAWAAGLALLVFSVYEKLPARRTLFPAAAGVAAALATAFGGGIPIVIAMAALASVGVAVVLTYDYSGSTPVQGSVLFAEHSWHIVLDRNRCMGVYACIEVCPESCFEKEATGSIVSFAHPDACIRCGACIVQCPKDALSFTSAEGQQIPPDVIRRYKLNLLGQRSLHVPESAANLSSTEAGDAARKP